MGVTLITRVVASNVAKSRSSIKVPALVNELTHFANERGILITIETEGSAFVETDYPIGLLSLSPKFSNSVPVVGAITPAGKVVDERMVKIHNRKRQNKIY